VAETVHCVTRTTPADITDMRARMLVRRPSSAIVLILWVGFVVYALVDGDAGTAIWVAVGLAAALLWILAVQPRLTVRRTPMFAGTSEWTIDASGKMRWDSLAKVVETPRAFLLYTTPRVCVILTKASIAAPDDAAKIRSWSGVSVSR
jgi:hypothetical protein